MLKRWASTGAAFASILIVPIVFESYTFHLYTIRDPSFFTFSGARLWVFLISIILSGVAIGLAGRFRPIVASGAAAVTISVLMAMLYQFCDAKQCYYLGPDGLGELRLWVLFFSTSSVGIMVGSMRHPREKSNVDGVFFGGNVAIFLGYFPWALLFGSYMPTTVGLAMLGFASAIPFLFSGAVCRFFSNSTKHAVYSAAIGWFVLLILFASMRPSSMPLLAVILACSVPSAVGGYLLESHASRKGTHLKSDIMIASLLGLFAFVALHPFIGGSMNLSSEPDRAILPEPTYYSGAYHQSETYLSTKRVEVQVALEQFDRGSVRDFLFAGIGAQSPNCCKDGLDYGYRADLFFNNSGTFLAARAWESCDYNVACSGFPWISTMHQAIVSLPAEVASNAIMLAMEWQPDGRTVKWYYGTDSNWKEYSKFVSPEIGNPYFNLGVIPVGNPISNADTGNAFFYQAGVSVPEQNSATGTIAMRCPAYFDSKGSRHCVDLEPIARGNSHWKALWKWGVQDNESVVKTDGSEMRVRLG